MQLFIMKTGAAGYGFFWAVVEEMHRTSKSEQTLANILTLGFVLGMKEDEIEHVKSWALKSGLWVSTVDGVASARAADEIRERTERVNEIKDKRKQNGSKGGQASASKRKQNEANASKSNPEEIRLDQIRLDNINTGNSPQLTLMASPPPKTKKIKQKLVNLIDMSEAEIVALGKHPSPLAPKNLTRKKEELVPIDEEGEEAKVWMTLEEFNRLVLKIGEDRTSEQISSLANYICSTPEKGLKYADHYRTVLQWERK